MENRESVLSNVDVGRYYRQYIGEAKSDRSQISCRSPFRDDRTPSFSVNLETGLWHDFGTGEGGDLIAFEMKRCGCDHPTALKNVAAFSQLTRDTDVNRRGSQLLENHRLRAIAMTDIREWNEILMTSPGDSARAYLNRRGITDETLREYLVGFDSNKSAVVIPLAFNADECTSAKFMYFDGSDWRKRNGKKAFRNHGAAVLYCADRIRADSDVVITEGEFDCLLLRQLGFAAATGTAGAGTWKDAWVDLFRAKDVIVLYDSDDEGRRGAKRVAQCLHGTARTIRICDLFPENPGDDKMRKDVSDFVTGGGEVDVLRRLMVGSPIVTEVDKVGETARTNVDPRNQMGVASHLLSTMEVIYVGTEFYIYKDGAWRPDRHYQVELAIAEVLGAKASKSRIESIKYLLQLKAHIPEDSINTDRTIINLRNGMLDLKSGNLLDHSRDYYSTIQLPFDYDPSATCPRWLQFVSEVTCNDKTLECLLQEMFGYLLIPDTSQQKMFWLVGPGGNGKGVAVKILESLIPKVNRTAVDIRNLHNPFVRAALYNRLLAVVGDLPVKLFGNEDLLKIIVGADTIDAQNKYGPQFEFEPSCRFVFAMNQLPTTRDTSHGFFRRVIMIPFNRIFKEPEQDRGLTESLRSELPGIFLWSVEGLNRLADRGHFSESPAASDQLRKYEDEFASVKAFLTSEVVFIENTKIRAEDLWVAYQGFCAEAGMEEAPRRTFGREIRATNRVATRTHRWGDESKPCRTYFGVGLTNG